VRSAPNAWVCTQRVGLQTHAHEPANPLVGSSAKRAGLPSVQGMAVPAPSVCSLELLSGTLAGPRARCLLPGLLPGARVWPYRPGLKPSARCLQPGSCGPPKSELIIFSPTKKSTYPLQSLQLFVVRTSLLLYLPNSRCF
jgi:hypothetical protein